MRPGKVWLPSGSTKRGGQLVGGVSNGFFGSTRRISLGRPVSAREASLPLITLASNEPRFWGLSIQSPAIVRLAKPVSSARIRASIVPAHDIT